jgi:hypothetical protein
MVLGLPFLFFWIATWVVATSLIMWVLLRLDRANEGRNASPTSAESERAR